jgi:hypothetical protein
VTLQAGQLAHLPVDLTCTLPVPHTRKNVTLLRAEADAEQLRSAADRDARTATERATERDTAAVDLAQAWRAWTSDAHTSELLGDVEWPVHPVVGPLILDAKALAGDADGDLFGLDQVAAEAARPAQRNKEIEAERAVLNAADKAGRERERTLRSERADWSPSVIASPTIRLPSEPCCKRLCSGRRCGEDLRKTGSSTLVHQITEGTAYTWRRRCRPC